MNLLLINATEILLMGSAVFMLYILAIAVLVRTKSNLLQYLLLFFLPVLGALGIVVFNSNEILKIFRKKSVREI